VGKRAFSYLGGLSSYVGNSPGGRNPGISRDSQGREEKKAPRETPGFL